MGRIVRPARPLFLDTLLKSPGPDFPDLAIFFGRRCAFSPLVEGLDPDIAERDFIVVILEHERAFGRFVPR